MDKQLGNKIEHDRGILLGPSDQHEKLTVLLRQACPSVFAHYMFIHS